MSQPHTRSPCTGVFSQATPALPCAAESSEPIEVKHNLRKAETFAFTPARSDASTPQSNPPLCSPHNKHHTKITPCEIFCEHLRNWASNHDSSVYFHGSISLHPQTISLNEDMGLGKSVNCVLTDASAGNWSKTIVIRLFQSQRYDEHPHQQGVRGSKELRHCQYSVPYLLVVRSGSGWVPARQYFDKQFFAHRARSRKGLATWHSESTVLSASIPRADQPGSAAHSTTRASGAELPPAAANSRVDNRSPGLASIMSSNGITNLALRNTPVTLWATPTSNSSVRSNDYRFAKSNLPFRFNRNVPVLAPSMRTGYYPAALGAVKISPLFRPFLRLPQELQDEILYHAIGHQRVIDLTQFTRSCSNSTSPITISELSLISKSISMHLVPHIYSSTNFRFGDKGFTKFLWQVGPFNRSKLRHLTFDFSKTSLLHCIRWLAPDPVWELFEPPVATNPPTLMYFWRCQLQDLMKELHLSTLTIDIRDVPLADLPMLVRIIRAAVGSVERIRVIDKHIRSDKSIGDFTQDLHRRFPEMLHSTWRDLSLQYFNDYKHERWHMRQILAIRDVDLCPILHTWMNKNMLFFDS